MKSQSVLVLLSASAVFAQQAIYEQCGGKIWTGGTSCASGTTCQVQNPYYSQCLPGSGGGQPAGGQPAGGNPNTPSNPVSSAAAPPANPASSAAAQPVSSAAAAASSAAAPPSSGGSGTVNTGSCGAYSGDKSGYASTTHYYDGQEGACGCGQGSMASWQTGDGSTIFTAAGSQNLFGGSSSWCGSGCGQCYELTNVGYVAAAGQGDCTGAGDTITVMITNLCPADGNAQWCSQPTDQYGYGAHFDILSQSGPKGWNNPIVSYKSVACPGSLSSDFATCQCASGATSRARRGLVGNDNFYPVF